MNLFHALIETDLSGNGTPAILHGIYDDLEKAKDDLRRILSEITRNGCCGEIDEEGTSLSGNDGEYVIEIKSSTLNPE